MPSGSVTICSPSSGEYSVSVVPSILYLVIFFEIVSKFNLEQPAKIQEINYLDVAKKMKNLQLISSEYIDNM